MKLIPFDPMHPLEKAETGVASGDVRFTPESGPFSSLAFMSAYDPKRKFDTPSQNNRIRTPRRSLEGPSLLDCFVPRAERLSAERDTNATASKGFSFRSVSMDRAPHTAISFYL